MLFLKGSRQNEQEVVADLMTIKNKFIVSPTPRKGNQYQKRDSRINTWSECVFEKIL